MVGFTCIPWRESSSPVTKPGHGQPGPINPDRAGPGGRVIKSNQTPGLRVRVILRKVHHDGIPPAYPSTLIGCST